MLCGGFGGDSFGVVFVEFKGGVVVVVGLGVVGVVEVVGLVGV